jgi:hypothetical protein
LKTKTLLRVIQKLTRGKSRKTPTTSWRDEEEEWGGRGAQAGEEKGKIAIAHLYPATTRAGTNVLTFVLGGGFD